MPKFSKECAEKSATHTVFGGAAGLDKIEKVSEGLLTSSLKPDMFGEPARKRLVDGIILVSWSVQRAVP